MPVQPQLLPTLQDGFRSILTFSEGEVVLGVVSVKPLGLDAGELIEQTTFDNEEVHTGIPGALLRVTPMTVTAAYAPSTLDTLMAMARTNQAITQSWPNGKQCEFWGSIQKVDPSELVIMGRPTVVLTIAATNLNDTGAETPPAWNENGPTTV